MVIIYIKTFGCSANQARSEKLASLLSEKYSLCAEPDGADVIILNICSLKAPTETEMLRFIHSNADKKVIVAGCFPLSFPNHAALKNVSVVGLNDFGKICEAVEKTLAGEHVFFLSKEKAFLECSPLRKNKLIAKIEIAQGCLSACAFCAGRLAHGALKSRSEEAILNEAKEAIASGAKELWLTCQDCGCYGFDLDTNIIELAKKVASLQGDFRIRLGMMNPQHAKNITPELIDLYKNPKVYTFLHVPVQAGSDRILKLMNRNYTVEQFKNVADAMRSAIPDMNSSIGSHSCSTGSNITIWTDIIVGFPSETEDEFKETIKLIEWLRPDHLNITRFWAREGTAAAMLPDQLHTKDTTARSRVLTEIFNKIKLEKNKEWIGKRCSVLVTEKGSKPNQWRGRNESYKPVLIESEESLLGRSIVVNIIKAEKDYLLADLENK